ncbi:hypothetical protein [Mesorhizobium sangaii]|uniref:Uncharacterized protein n=1 Tax=Mesorhizobium sangaii TaxID=505389 RepID=A0A841PBW5_9HYPH|nr:hypothetical protein [Mesorhizobium sangaii]MBB6412814.1 hypothetical protein [Mesorhizobium sangaii]
MPVSPVLPQDVPDTLSVGIATCGLVTGSANSGVGMPIVELTPKLLSSEEPSGIPTAAPRLVDDVPVVLDGVAVVPKDEALDAVELQVPAAVETVGFTNDVPLVDVVAFMPPPSKVERAEVAAATSELDAKTLGAKTLVHPELLMELFPMSTALPVKPPGSSSTAPRGIAIGLRGEPTAERGDVIPVAGVVLICAKLGPLNKRATATVIRKIGIATSCSFRIGTTVVSCV